MRHRSAVRLLRNTRRIILLHTLGLAVVCLVPLIGSPVGATDTPVNVELSGNPQSPVLVLDDPTSPIITETMPITISGTVQALNQIQVYINGIYSGIIPLSPATTNFVYSLNLPIGTHSIKLVGVSAYMSYNPTVSFVVKYQLPNSPVTENPPSEGPTAGSATTGGIIIGDSIASDNKSLDHKNNHTNTIPEWLMNGLIILDLARPDQGGLSWTVMIRFLMVVIGLVLVIFANWIFAVYKQVAVRLFGESRRKTKSEALSKKTLIRLVGFGLIIVAIIYI